MRILVTIRVSKVKKEGDHLKYYSQLSELKVFTLKEAAAIMKNKENASVMLNNMMRKGLVKRVKRDMYYIVDPNSLNSVPNKYIIASNINNNSFVSLKSAFEYYGLLEDKENVVYTSSLNKFDNFSFCNNLFKYYQTNTLVQVEKINGINLPTIERTIVDNINMLGKVMTLNELLKCLDLLESIMIDRIKEMLTVYNKDVLYRKVGYILSFYKDKLKIDDDFFKFCLEKSNVKNMAFLSSSSRGNTTYNKEWGLYVPHYDINE